MRSRNHLFLVALVATSAGCSSTSKQAPPTSAADPNDAGPAASDAGGNTIAGRHFSDFATWASPIDDFLKIGRKTQGTQFNSAITELAPFGERMFIGYGDANVNLGEQTPIEMRAFSSADDPATQALTIDGAGQGAPQTSPVQTGEEEIDRFRVLDGELWQAGVDSIDPDELWTQSNTNPKSIQGNVYRLDGDVIRKHRSITGGEHVHDLASYGGAIYSVGSGADTRTEFEAGQVFRYLWKSSDRGVSFQTVTRVQVTEPGNMDTRWVNLLATNAKLYVFGYESTFSTNASKIKNATYDGQTVTELTKDDPLGRIYPDGTLALPDGSGLLWGIDVTTPGVPAGIVARLGADGALTPFKSFDGSTILDVSLVAATSEILYLVIAGSEDDKTTHWDARVLVAPVASPDATTELIHFETSTRPVAIAYFKGALFLGTGTGKVLRATAD